MKTEKRSEISRTTKPNTKLTGRKLFRNRETLRILSAQRLEDVAGGYVTCFDLSTRQTALASVYRCCVFLSLALLLGFPGRGNALVDDRRITITSTSDVTNKRQALIQYIWGSEGFPASRLPRVDRHVARLESSLTTLENLERVDTLTIAMEAGLEGLAYHFIPQRKNNRLVVLHTGHDCWFDDVAHPTDFGMRRTLSGLLSDGYSVLAVYMPHYRPDDCPYISHTISHDDMFNISSLRPERGSAMKFFLEPVAVSLNYLKTMSAVDGFPHYEDFSMAGLSGGGWTTTVYAAIDPTINFSFPVAGSIPLYLRPGGPEGDTEQKLSNFYQIAGYPDLYVLGSYGPGRKQVQILNRRDDCCFGEALYDPVGTGIPWDQAMRNYESQVRSVLNTLGSGFFRLEIDEAATAHQISCNAINVILSELNGARRYIGATSSRDAFVRSMNGHLWHDGPGGWEDTGFAMVGVPAVLSGAVNIFDVFYRNPSNQLMHAYRTSRGWTSGPLIHDTAVISDPVAASWGPGRFDVVAFGRDYKLYHWWNDTRGMSSEQVNNSVLGTGSPSLVARGPNQLDIFFRGWDRRLHHMRSSGAVPWTEEALGSTIILDFPSAVATREPALRVYARGQGGELLEASQVGGEPWRWNSISAITGTTAVLGGSPSASVLSSGTAVVVHARTTRTDIACPVSLPCANQLSTFTLWGSWSFSNNGGTIAGSPTSVPGGVFVRAEVGSRGHDWRPTLWLFDGATWFWRGIFD